MKEGRGREGGGRGVSCEICCGRIGWGVCDVWCEDV